MPCPVDRPDVFDVYASLLCCYASLFSLKSVRKLLENYYVHTFYLLKILCFRFSRLVVTDWNSRVHSRRNPRRTRAQELKSDLQLINFVWFGKNDAFVNRQVRTQSTFCQRRVTKTRRIVSAFFVRFNYDTVWCSRPIRLFPLTTLFVCLDVNFNAISKNWYRPKAREFSVLWTRKSL